MIVRCVAVLVCVGFAATVSAQANPAEPASALTQTEAAAPVTVPATDPASPAEATGPLEAEAATPTVSTPPADVTPAVEPAAPLPIPPATELSPAVSAPYADSRLPFNIQIHGFVSEGGFKSTANEYVGSSSRGSLKFFEGAINFSAELTDQLRVGLQFVSRSVGTLSEEVPRIDWAVADYRFWSWLGLRAGVIKMPLGLYNESVSVDAARTAILLPQGIYPLRNRDALISHTGFAVHGTVPLGAAGAVDYQGWFGTLSIPRSALELQGATLESVDTRYVTGGQAFWRMFDGLRVGASYLRTYIDFNVQLNPDLVAGLIMQGQVPEDYQGALRITQNPTGAWVLSAEYIVNGWSFAAEYSRWFKRQVASPEIVPKLDEDAERFYAMANYRLGRYVELGSYFSVSHADADDRKGNGSQFDKPYLAFQRDLAATLRIDINEYWLWKLEGHFMDGASELQTTRNPKPERYWGLFLFRTTVTF